MPVQTSCNKYTDQTALRNKIVIRFYFFSRMFGRLQLFAYLCTRKTKPSVGALVQLVRIHACHAWGHGFESRTHRKIGSQTASFFCAYNSHPRPRGQGCSPHKGDSPSYAVESRTHRKIGSQTASFFCFRHLLRKKV